MLLDYWIAFLPPLSICLFANESNSQKFITDSISFRRFYLSEWGLRVPAPEADNAMSLPSGSVNG